MQKNTYLFSSFINIEDTQHKFIPNIASNINIQYNSDDYLLYRCSMPIFFKIIKEYEIPEFSNYLALRFFNFDCQKWKNKNFIAYESLTVPGILSITSNNILITGNTHINQNTTLYTLVQRGVNDFTKQIESKIRTRFLKSLNTKQLKQNSILVNNIKILNDFLNITAKNDNSEIGFEIQNNTNTPKFVWKYGNKGWQFYCIDKNNQLVPFIYSPQNYKDKFISTTGSYVSGELIIKNSITNNKHQVTKGYIDYLSHNFNVTIGQHNHDDVYLKKTGGQFINDSMLNLNYQIDWDSSDKKIQINKETWDNKIKSHNHDSLYINRTGGILSNNLIINKRQYVNLDALTMAEENRQQTKYDVDKKQQDIYNYNHTNYLFKTKNLEDSNYVEYNGQIFLKNLPRFTSEGEKDFANKEYVDLISGKLFNGFFKLQFTDINLGWVSQMYEYDFNFENWFNAYYQLLPEELKQIYGKANSYIIFPIVTYKTLRFTNSNLGQYKGQDGIGIGTNKLINYKICKPYYYSLIEGIKCMYKFKLRLGQFGINQIEEGNTYAQSNQTSGYVNFRIYFIGGPQPLFIENWNSDTNNNGDLRITSSLYNEFNLLNTLYCQNETTNIFNPNFDDYTIEL